MVEWWNGEKVKSEIFRLRMNEMWMSGRLVSAWCIGASKIIRQ